MSTHDRETHEGPNPDDQTHPAHEPDRHDDTPAPAPAVEVDTSQQSPSPSPQREAGGL